jgi:glycosyltransferase involved in cell wall biosynthesis
MKILYLIPILSGGGAERQLTYLASGVASRGHTVHIGYLYAGPDIRIRDWYAERGIVLHQIPAASNFDPLMLIRLFRLVRRERYDLMQTCIHLMDVLGGLTALACRIPWVVREAGSPDNWTSLRFAGLRRLLARFSSHIVANSAEGCRYWKDVGSDRRSSLVPNAFPLAQIRQVCEKKSRPRGLAPARPYILYVGRLEPLKNVGTLVDAFVQWNRKDVELWIVGDGSLRQDLENAVGSAPADNIRLLGVLPPEEVWARMRGAQFLALLSDHEGFPNVVAEAAILECPVLLSDTVAHRAIWDEQSVVFVDQKNRDAVLGALDKLSADADLRCRLAERAFEVARAFSLERMVDAYLRIYVDVTKDTIVRRRLRS